MNTELDYANVFRSWALDARSKAQAAVRMGDHVTADYRYAQANAYDRCADHIMGQLRKEFLR